ncbi:uncharacterized protein K444DRAFT_542672 [Hyaloscypha bicolor E]|uniref:Ammonium transporter AmtB-like domain-containing protein n=1 Tax=Hyaloscypha bicolor E TaxID=1095630 RepID=A0A2J6SPW3_9HELO|nr:uncharacterized protein K444DRAFT_542672 [Hyaloscypha bicolor E]PMD52815.1 hypothetical protein K444DRAFT_542672 [Hyaloscypha bicolor E]
METFTLDVVPPVPRNLTALNVSVSYSDLIAHPELFFQGSDLVWMMASGALVMLMIPAVCLFNSGASDRYSALIMFRLPFITTAFIGVQWYLWGYSLAFSPAVSPASSPWSWYGGSTKANALQDTVARPVGAAGAKIPELAFVFLDRNLDTSQPSGPRDPAPPLLRRLRPGSTSAQVCSGLLTHLTRNR